jgi:hypothetical protein
MLLVVLGHSLTFLIPDNTASGVAGQQPKARSDRRWRGLSFLPFPVAAGEAQPKKNEHT